MDRAFWVVLLILLPVAVFASVMVYNLTLQNRLLTAKNRELRQTLATEPVMRDAQAITMFRTLRHTVMNDLQVIMGWLQLGNAQRAAAQSEVMRARLVREGQLMGVKPAGLIHGILSRSAWAEANGLRVSYLVADDLTGCEGSDDRFAGPFSDALGGLFEALLGAGGQACTLTVGRAGDSALIDVQCDIVLGAELPPASDGVTVASHASSDGVTGSLIRFTVSTKTDGE